MPVAHAVASGLNGLRAAGDLVARLEMGRGMRLTEAKRTVADALGVGTIDLGDPIVMDEVRGELKVGRTFEAETPRPLDPSPLEAKARIAELLDLPVNALVQRAARR
jgi:dimethylamine--corrinoid protein Co-methyltransferase